MFPCAICDRLFGSAEALKQHRTDSPMHAKTSKCEICGRSFGSEQALEQHRRDAPAHAEAFACNICSRSFGSAGALKQHQRDSPSHGDSIQAPFFVDLEPAASNVPEPRVLEIKQVIDLPRRDTGKSQPKTTKKKPPTRKLETREVFTCPELHQWIAEAIAPHTTTTWFFENDLNKRRGREHHTNIMGRFLCNNTACKRQSWGSKIIAVTIKEFPPSGYIAMVYNQRCRSCDFLGDLQMDKECYIERVSYRLKRWAGVQMEPPPFEEPKGPPHKVELCEGCKRGVCRQSQRFRSDSMF